MLENSKKIAADAWLKFLCDRFNAKINPSEYVLCYSGGMDSHFLYWFIKEFYKCDEIEIVGVNTSFEIPEIRDRIIKNSDTVLFPAMNRYELKEKYGIPCFSKIQDEFISRYQNGSRSENTMRVINGENVYFNLNKTARELTVNEKLHKVSNKCCLYNKEKPMIDYCKKVGKKSIIGVRASESKLRKSKYETCMQKNGDFTPLFDVSDEMMELFYEVYNIEKPRVYNVLDRTGCAGCPYGRNTEKELAMLPDTQLKQTVKFFKESYDVLGVNYKELQTIFY